MESKGLNRIRKKQRMNRTKKQSPLEAFLKAADRASALVCDEIDRQGEEAFRSCLIASIATSVVLHRYGVGYLQIGTRVIRTAGDDAQVNSIINGPELEDFNKRNVEMLAAGDYHVWLGFKWPGTKGVIVDPTRKRTLEIIAKHPNEEIVKREHEVNRTHHAAWQVENPPLDTVLLPSPFWMRIVNREVVVTFPIENPNGTVVTGTLNDRFDEAFEDAKPIVRAVLKAF